MALTGLLAGCAPGQFSTQAQRIGPDDGTDACRTYLVALDSTGNFFGAQIVTGAAIGALGGAALGGLISGSWRGAALGALAGGVAGGTTAYWSALQQQQMDQAALYQRVSSDLERENAQIDKTQLAFDELTDCRFRQAQTIRADYHAGRIGRAQAEAAMDQVRDRARRDLQLAQLISRQIQDRGQQFQVAVSNVGPGPAPRPPAVAPQPAVLRRSAALKIRPDPSAPDIARLHPHERVQVTGGRNGYALVETPNGSRGYLAASDLQSPGARRSVSIVSSVARSNGGDVRTLAGSNAARRDDFAQSVAVTQSAQASGFELTAG
ncbi:MAG TPA: SH3 domain-containing protein [Acetobacteraceae bacterium]|nr:SH3 domain-containing protein [Acetobacteraceae bacterium]